jgi:hypothetical protein
LTKAWKGKVNCEWGARDRDEDETYYEFGGWLNFQVDELEAWASIVVSNRVNEKSRGKSGDDKADKKHLDS